MEFKFRSIGVIHSPFKESRGAPIQPAKSSASGSVEVFDEFVPGLEDIGGFSHIILLYAFHKSKGFELRVKPFLDEKKRGLFATRAPWRPNPIGVSVVGLEKAEGNTLFVNGIDALDGSPLLDIKPFVPGFNRGGESKIGWLEGKIVGRAR
jgi:tRNA-Thr(GGU) m(6)t(6)A37 methyltransferase TsaA